MSKGDLGGHRSNGLDRRAPGDVPAGERIRIVEIASVEAKFEQLGVPMPGLPFIVPRNFESASSIEAFVHESRAPDAAIIARTEGLEITLPGPTPLKTIQEYDATIIAVVVHVGAQILQDAVAVAFVRYLEVLGRRLLSRRLANAGQEEIVQELIVSRNKRSKRITYRGPVSGLPQLVDVAKEVLREDE